MSLVLFHTKQLMYGHASSLKKMYVHASGTFQMYKTINPIFRSKKIYYCNFNVSNIKFNVHAKYSN